MKRVALCLPFLASAAYSGCPHPYVHFEPFQSGDRIAYCAPLPDVLSEFNRRNTLQLVLVGSTKKWPEIEGEFSAVEPDELLETLLNSRVVRIVSGSQKEHIFRLTLVTNRRRVEHN